MTPSIAPNQGGGNAGSSTSTSTTQGSGLGNNSLPDTDRGSTTRKIMHGAVDATNSFCAAWIGKGKSGGNSEGTEQQQSNDTETPGENQGPTGNSPEGSQGSSPTNNNGSPHMPASAASQTEETLELLKKRDLELAVQEEASELALEKKKAEKDSDGKEDSETSTPKVQVASNPSSAPTSSSPNYTLAA